MTYRIAVDTGGTFTDVVVTDGEGSFWSEKAPSTPTRPFMGVSEGLDLVARQMQIPRDRLLSGATLLTYATTHAINAIITGNTAKTAFLTTAGFPDTLLLREGGKTGPYDFSAEYPDPYIPRSLTFEIHERVTSEGEIAVPLADDEVMNILRLLREIEIEAVAVCLLWSFMNPSHELRVAELLREELPECSFTLSHRLSPRIREYRRASATAIDASLKPLMRRHLGGVAESLREEGFVGELLVVTSSGGTIPVGDAVERPIYCVSSGPSIAPVGALASATDEGMADAMIVCDMGGTSFDVSLVREGRVQFTREAWLGAEFTGHITGLASVAVQSIGYGGGSIAWIDDGGLLRVGPHSAGSEPGPVAYGLGGQAPTVTDAAVVLGYIDPRMFLGGRMPLDAKLATDAVQEHIAGPLGITVEEGALGILAVAVDEMAQAIREITINQGIDPRESILIGGGGASGLCAGPIAAQLGCEVALMPANAAVLSASGGLYSDIVTEVSASYETDSGDFDCAGVNNVLRELEHELDLFLDHVARGDGATTKEFIVEARYRYQVWELEVHLNLDCFTSDNDVGELERLFHEAHERVFGVHEPGQRIECLFWRGRATARLPIPVPGRPPSEQAGERRHADAYFRRLGTVSVPRFAANDLAADVAIDGPAVLDLPTTTIVVYPGSKIHRTSSGNFVMAISSPDDLDLLAGAA